MTTSVPPYQPIAQREYAHPEVLVSTEWVAAHLDDPAVRFVESDEDVLLYDSGHIPGAVKVDWVEDLNHHVVRDYIDREQMQALLRDKGINRDTTIVLYGDKSNWWACYALWVLRLFGLTNLRIMDGGRHLWEKEGRPLVADWPSWPPGDIEVPPRDDPAIRAFRDDVLAHVKGEGALVDVRSTEEFRGERLHMPDYPNEGATRGGHIPGARNVLWARSIHPENHTFRNASDLVRIYVREQDLRPDADTIVYCRIGERSAHTWFVLTYLLGFPRVRNYDGSWTEWGNLVGVPIEK